VSLPYSKAPAALPLEQPEAPVVYFTAETMSKVRYLVQQCDDEAAWFGVVEEVNDNDFLVTQIFVPDQTVTGASVDIDGDAIAKMVHQHDIDSYFLRYHGHSHVNMAVEPSGTDQAHILDYLENYDWFIRSITNKKGDMRVDVFDKRVGYAFQNVTYGIWELLQTEEWYAEVDKEIEDKVKTKKFQRSQWHSRTPQAINPTTPWPPKEDLLEYFGGMTPAQREHELRLLTPEDRRELANILEGELN
jgi:hypothetical protein